MPNRHSKLTIGNFKAFGSKIQEIPIKPITLIFGANSSGKSSLMHSLLWLNHAIKTSNFDVNIPIASEGKVDLGGFNQLLNQSATEKIITVGWESQNTDGLKKMSFELQKGMRFPTPQNQQSYNMRFEMDVTSHSASTEKGATCVSRIRFYTFGNLLFSASLKQGKMIIDSIFHENDLIKSHIQSSVKSHPGVNKELYEKVLNLYVQQGGYCLCLSNLSNHWLEVLPYPGHVIYNECMPLFGGDQAGISGSVFEADQDIQRYLCNTLDMPLKDIPIDGGFEKLYYSLSSDFSALMMLMSLAIEDQISELIYVSGLRNLPERNFDPFQSKDEAWRQFAYNKSVRNQVNSWLGKDFMKTPYQLDVLEFVLRSTFEEAFQKKKTESLSNLPPSDVRFELTIRDQNSNATVSLQDVGIGISQVVPILIHAMGNKNKLICIEQPEIHIHPALQAEMGDLFIESALGENQNTFLLETHSEHLILRILRRIRETTRKQLPDGCPPITPDDVAVLYVQPGEDGATVRELRIDAHGRFKDDWPNGFFEERLDEVF